MDKIIFKNKILFAAMAAIFFVACEDSNEIVDQVVANTKRGAIVRTIAVTENEVTYDIPTGKITGGGFAATVEVQDQEDGNLLSELNVYIGYIDNTSTKGNSTIGDKEVLAETFTSSDGTIGEFGLPRFTYEATAAELQSTLGITEPEIFGGDQFTIRFEVVLTDGSKFSAADNSGPITAQFFSSPFIYTSLLVCAPKPPQPGVWTIEMTDSYDDGWQTNTGSGGDGITVTLSDGTVFEIGMCSTSMAATGTFLGGTNCLAGPTNATATITIPEGMTSAEWFFPGDRFGEIGFEIITPAGNVVGTKTSNNAGPIVIDYCAD